MVRIVTGNAATFDAITYREPHPATVKFLSDRLNSLVESGKSLFTEAGNRFMAGARTIYDNTLGENALRRARAVARTVQNAFQRDEVRALTELSEIQNASPRMQRWVMANLRAREMFQNQQLDGYSDTYLDLAPGDVGEQHYDYRRVMDGLVQDTETVTEEGEIETGWKLSLYFEGELVEGDRRLDMTEVADVSSTWDAMKAYLDIGENDPTSVLNCKL